MAALDDDTGTMRRILAARPPREQVRQALAVAVSGGTLVDIDRPPIGSCHDDAVRLLQQADPPLSVLRTAPLRIAIWWARIERCGTVLAMLRK
jgi:hypothetical protein